MAMFSFDKFNQNEIPNFYLANPDSSILFNLGTIYNRNFELRFNTLSKLTFTAPKEVDGIASDYYDWLQYRRLINVENLGVFMITNVEITNDGAKEVKEVTAESWETSFSYKKVSLFQGGYYFYNSIYPQGTLLYEIMQLVPSWSLGEVDPELDTVTADMSIDNLYRTFEVADKTVYDFMVNEIAPTYQCTFKFDNINRTVSVYKLQNATTLSDIFISFDNLMKSLTIKQSTDEMVTALTVIGGEGLEINLVNPLGTSTIYDFSYFKNTDWMSQNLIDALTAWEDKIDFYQVSYANLLTDYRNETETLLTMQSDLATLNAELAALQQQLAAAIAAKQSTTAIQAQISAKNTQIVAKESEILIQQNSINTIYVELVQINTELSFDNLNNFTVEEIQELSEYIIGNTYTNTNYIQTNIMSQYEIQNQAQALYDLGKDVLAKVAQPRYTFEIDSANFVFLKEYEPFINQLALGCQIIVEIRPDYTVTAALLGIDFNYDDPSQFKIVLSNRLRMDDEEFQYQDLFGSMVDSSVTTVFNSQKWNSASKLYSNISGSQVKILLSTTTSQQNNIPVYSDTTGGSVKDIGAKYLQPSSFTPEIISDTATYDYNYNTGWYTLIGRICFINAIISVATISGAGTDQVKISLPLPAKTYDNFIGVMKIGAQNINWVTGTDIIGLIASGETVIALNTQGDAVAHTAVLSNMLGATTIIYVSGFYFID